MVDIVLDTDELSVLAGPSKVSVQVDIGSEGDRGSIFVVGTGDPNTLTLNNEILGVSVQPFDMYINAEKGNFYSKLYQYVPSDGGTLQWQPTITLFPNVYSVKKTVTFTSGSTTISDISVADIADIESLSALTSDNFSVQISFAGDNVVASSFSLSSITSGKLPITIKAYEFDGTDWAALSGSKTVHILITVV